MLEPMTPPEADLQDFPFMPLHVARLRDSDLAAEGHPEGCWYAVLLWAASWHQLPAGSLPDNDAVLARLCGLGRDLRTFRKRRDDALRGFVKCSDGRLYHPVVAEQVVAAWQSKLEQRWRTECARVKKANQRNGTDISCPTFDEFVARQRDDDVPQMSRGTKPHIPEDKGSKGQGQGQGKRQGDSDDDDVEREHAPDLPSDLIELTDELCRVAGVRHVDPGRVMANQAFVKSWLAEGFDPETEIIPTIRQLVTEAREPIYSLKFFDAALRQNRARQEATRNGSRPRSGGNFDHRMRDPILDDLSRGVDPAMAARGPG
jgi:hypothetical protein